MGRVPTRLPGALALLGLLPVRSVPVRSVLRLLGRRSIRLQPVRMGWMAQPLVETLRVPRMAVPQVRGPALLRLGAGLVIRMGAVVVVGVGTRVVALHVRVVRRTVLGIRRLVSRLGVPTPAPLCITRLRRQVAPLRPPIQGTPRIRDRQRSGEARSHSEAARNERNAGRYRLAARR